MPILCGGDHLLGGLAAAVGQLAALDVGPQPLDRVQLRRIRRQVVDLQPVLVGEELAHGGALVGFEVVPDQVDRRANEEGVQPGESLDQGGGVIAAAVEANQQPCRRAVGPLAQHADHRDLGTVALAVAQYRGHPAWRPGAADRRGQRNCGLVQEAQPGFAQFA